MDELAALLHSLGQPAIAVSGGVDSMTLMGFAHALLGDRAVAYHAVSPAVPQAATVRVRKMAAARAWPIEFVNAGEFDDPDYLRNPINRCFFCKSNLYAAIAACTGEQIVSGANIDDLEDYRPGLAAAADHGVRHPFIEVGCGKANIRALARNLHLDDVAELAASPCLSSRVETGLSIDPNMLVAIDRAETALRLAIDAVDIRCRLRDVGVVIELDEGSLADLDATAQSHAVALVASYFPDMDVRIQIYRRGSAFIGRPVNG